MFDRIRYLLDSCFGSSSVSDFESWKNLHDKKGDSNLPYIDDGSKTCHKWNNVTNTSLIDYTSKDTYDSCDEGFLTNIIALWYAKSELPVGFYLGLLAIIGYFISPVDIVPDFIPILGYIDDVSVVGAFYVMVRHYIPKSAKKKARDFVQKYF